MANPQAILNKITRNMEQRGYYNPGNSVFANPSPPVQVVETTTSALPGPNNGINTPVVQLTQANSHVVTVYYSPAVIQSPMGGVNPMLSPYLGIGIANPGRLCLQGASGDNTLAAIFTDSATLELFYELAGYDNTVIVLDGTTGLVQLAQIRGSESLLGMGS